MRINYCNLENEIISNLEKNRIWILSTSYKDNVTSRSMSIINKGLYIFFQTNKCYIKHSQMQENNKVSLCFNNISIEGTVEEIGDWKEEKNIELMDLYKSDHLGSYNAYGSLDGQVVYKITPKTIKLWKYVEENPIRQILYVDKKVAEQLDFM
ncbi:pyridoxamine 5'-phosphate oxidase family protein [Clostridium gasigenes]|uniref:General stress protein 26 n=1 Tax=Clostridium gasigenes TaxID=94869 RepID=A0A1H0U2U2_9CLOT|nr:pyridoxamine 5'-phosphate oxidase family protein [Clostridium gasigenes]MBB6622819.1 pyridoxamine 5'-phosphate oxidase family protein [Clostridium gasigenes]NKF06184.1 pyridoxamine 5'-phosphate oxidase family protein [Clostridium gasigenes]QSW20071.1 pyridoxamine 5'-phosphate oxidase family protein [Clostridium gasigenes]SDP60587.1 General stress protein 26 [Clostridium gasigenes]